MIKYFIEYQHMPKGSARPIDDGEIVGIEVSDKGGFAALPSRLPQKENGRDLKSPGRVPLAGG